MKTLHLSVGVFVVIIFLLTGQYLSFRYPNIGEMDTGLRLLLRSRHIYILLAGTLNIGLGLYFSYRPRRWRKNMQVIGSGLLILASLLLIAAFFYEPGRTSLGTPLSHFGLYAIFGGTMLHLISGLKYEKTQVTE